MTLMGICGRCVEKGPAGRPPERQYLTRGPDGEKLCSSHAREAWNNCDRQPDSEQNAQTDGGFAQGPQAGAAAPPTRGQTWTCWGCDTPFGGPADVVTEAGEKYCSLACYFDDVGFLGSEYHRCDLCDQVFDDVDELADHDCQPVDDLVAGGGGGRDGE